MVLVGTDCPGLSAGHMKEALDSLERHTAVIGPTNDWGYYLIGLNETVPDLFAGIEWGTDRVLAQTMAQPAQFGIIPKLLVVLDDIDRPEDLVIWEREGGQKPTPRPD